MATINVRLLVAGEPGSPTLNEDASSPWSAASDAVVIDWTRRRGARFGHIHVMPANGRLPALEHGLVARGRIELPTRRFSVSCSTD